MLLFYKDIKFAKFRNYHPIWLGSIVEMNGKFDLRIFVIFISVLKIVLILYFSYCMTCIRLHYIIHSITDRSRCHNLDNSLAPHCSNNDGRPLHRFVYYCNKLDV